VKRNKTKKLTTKIIAHSGAGKIFSLTTTSVSRSTDHVRRWAGSDCFQRVYMGMEQWMYGNADYCGLRDGFTHGSDYWIYVWMEGCEMGLPMVVFYLFLQIVVIWSICRTSVHQMRGRYFPDALRTRRSGTGVLLGTYCC